MEKYVFCYVAKNPNLPGFYAAVVDSKEHAKDTAKVVASYIKEGAIVFRVSVEDAQSGLKEYVEAKRKLKTSGPFTSEDLPK